jgi:hypothetical protein
MIARHANDAFGQPWFTLLDAALKKESVTVLPSAYAPTSLDLSPDLGKLESQHPGAIVAEGFGSRSAPSTRPG